MPPKIFTHTSVDTEDILMFGCEKIIITHNLEVVFQKRIKGNQKMARTWFLYPVDSAVCIIHHCSWLSKVRYGIAKTT